jgi:vacuolar-type H+-ATPase subunit H
LDSFVESVTDAFETINAPSEVIDDIEETGEQLVDEIADIEDDTDNVVDEESEVAHDTEEIENEVEQLRDDLAETRREQAEDRQRISEVEETIEDAGLDEETPTPNGGETTLRPDDLTPIEQLARADNIEEVTDSPTVERAVALFSNLPDWGSKTPRGIVLKPADNPLRLLEADRDEQLAWKQYYRAAEALERLSHGSVTFVDHDRHGKMICLHEQSEAYERAVNGELTPSSVGAEG